MKRSAVLIVDDEKNIRLTLSQALEPLGAEIGTAVNGEEALAKLKERDFDVILLDLRMPGMDGLEVLRQVRELRPDIHVIVITAHGTVESAVDAMKVGAVDFIQKPFAPKEIRALVAKAMDKEGREKEEAADYASHIELAKQALSEKHLDAAEEHVRQAIELDSSKPQAFNLLGAIFELRGSHSEAQENYRVALEVEPTYGPARENYERTTRMPVPSGILLEDADEVPLPDGGEAETPEPEADEQGEG